VEEVELDGKSEGRSRWGAEQAKLYADGECEGEALVIGAAEARRWCSHRRSRGEGGRVEEMQGGAYISEEMWIVEGLFLICLLTGMLVSEAHMTRFESGMDSFK